MLLTFLNTLATIISVISLLIVTYGVLVGFVAFLRNEIKRFNGTYTVNNIRQLRADFGSYLLLGLEFLIASDILKTVVDPTLDELAILGGVVMVRTVLSVFLNKEIKNWLKTILPRRYKTGQHSKFLQSHVFFYYQIYLFLATFAKGNTYVYTSKIETRQKKWELHIYLLSLHLI